MADEVIIRGKVSGPIRGIHVELQAGAHVEGDVVNTTIAIENGAHIHGSVWHSEDPLTGERRLTTSALLTFVALDKEGRRLTVPPLCQWHPPQS